MRIDQFISGDALEELGDVIVLVGADGRILDANLAALVCYGYDADELKGMRFSDLEVDGRDAADPDTTVDGLGGLVEERHRRNDGTVVPVEVRTVRVGDDGTHAVLKVVHDITDRKCAEEALRESEAKHSAMISNISDVIGIIGVDGFMTYKSPNIEKWFGWKPEDLIGTDGWLTVHPDDLERIQAEFYAVLQVDNQARTVEYRYLCKDGSYRWIELTATNMVNDPIISGVLLNYHDITERRQMERLSKELTSVIDVLGTVAEMRDPYTAGHQRRVSELASAMARDMGMPEPDIEDIRIAGLIHDIGKMSVPAELLSRPSRLSSAEFSVIRVHAEAGYNIISSARMPGAIAELVYQHHERCDGSGYPRGLTANNLLQGGKVLMVADVVEAMMSHRPYRPALGLEAALSEIEHGAGRLYDAAVADSCHRLFRESAFAFSEV